MNLAKTDGVNKLNSMFQQTRLLHCGPLAHEMVEDYIDCSTPPDHKKWEIFILSKFKGDMDLQPGTLVLQQVNVLR